MTREHAEKIFDEYVEKGKTEKTGRTGFVKELMDLTEKNRKNLEKLVSEQVNKAIGQLNLSTSDDIKRIEKKLNQLLSKE